MLGRHEAPLLKHSQQDMKPYGERNKTASHMRGNRDRPSVDQFSHAEAGTTHCCSASALTVFLLCGWVQWLCSCDITTSLKSWQFVCRHTLRNKGSVHWKALRDESFPGSRVHCNWGPESQCPGIPTTAFFRHCCCSAGRRQWKLIIPLYPFQPKEVLAGHH